MAPRSLRHSVLHAVSLIGLAFAFGGPIRAAVTVPPAALAAGADSAIDPRLGAPFAVRERAVLGSANATVLVIEFSSFKCDHCREFHERVFPALRREYIDSGKVQWVIVNASNHPADAEAPIFRVARAALHQGTYWQVVDALFALASTAEDALISHLQRSPAFQTQDAVEAWRAPAIGAAVAADFADYDALGIRGTPSFVLQRLHPDGRRTSALIEDIQSPDYYRRAFEALLAQP